MTPSLPFIHYLKLRVMFTGLLALAALVIWQTPHGQATEHGSAIPTPKEIHIGLRAHDGEQRSLQRWAPTADYLSTQLPDYRFVMIPFESIAEMNEAVSRDEFDFVFTNPSSYVEYAHRHGVRHLATLVNKRQNRGYAEFGSVIFTRADRQDINILQDLKGKSVMGVSEQAFGGWRAAWYEMRTHSIDPYNDFAKIMFAGGNQPDVVAAVYNGTADAGTVRTDMLEDLAAAGKINLSDFKVINTKQVEGFPFALSTALFLNGRLRVWRTRMMPWRNRLPARC